MKSWLVALCVLSCGLSDSRISAQELLQQTDVGFSQIAVGPDLETVMVLTNRGVFDYQGVLLLSRGRDGLIWNPVINGEAVENGEYPVVIGVDETIRLSLTADAVQSGAGILVSTGLLIPDVFVEASLTYHFRSEGQIVDSVGILATQEFYLATIPFEDFSTVGLALANASVFTLVDTQIALSLIDSAGNLIDGIQFGLPPYGHDAQFLFEHFPDVPLDLGLGKLEIFATAPVIGTTLTLVGPPGAPQLSTLPLFPAPTAYDFAITASDDTRFEGVMALWAEGFFVKGYLVVLSVDGVELAEVGLTLPILVNGQLIDGFLDLSFFAASRGFFGDLQPDEETTVYLGHSDFAFGDAEVSGGRFILLYLDDQTTLTGSFALTRITP